MKEEQTLCVEAHIFPDSSCLPTVNWSGANLKVTGACETDSVVFRVSNVGTAPSTGGRVGIIIEDQVVFLVRPTVGVLSPNTSVNFKYPINGSTYRLDMPQEVNNPSLSRVQTAAVEGCRTNGQTNYTVNKVNQFVEADADRFIDKECQILRGDFVANEIEAFPQGYRDQHFINETDGIEYEIRFRNMGSDTVFAVQVRDTLSEFIDPNSIELGASSHPYTFAMFGKNLLKFNVNPYPKLPKGTKIVNRGAVNFNYGGFTATNQAFHTIGQDFIITATVDKPLLTNVKVKVYPNPFTEQATFEIENGPLSKENYFSLYDMSGKLVRTEIFYGDKFEFVRHNITSGLYVFKIENDGIRIATGKLMVRN